MLAFLVTRGSYLAIVLVLMAAGAGLPVPEEIPVIAAGVLASNGQLDPWLALLACIVGAIGGDCVLYAIGRLFGRGVVLEHPRMAHFVNAEREAKVEEMLRRHGVKVLFAARFLVGLRSPIYLTAGILRMPLRKFLLTDLISATTVVSTFFYLSYYHGHRIAQWVQRAEVIVTVVAVIAASALLTYLYRRHRRKQAAALPMPLVRSKVADAPEKLVGVNLRP